MPDRDVDELAGEIEVAIAVVVVEVRPSARSTAIGLIAFCTLHE